MLYVLLDIGFFFTIINLLLFLVFLGIVGYQYIFDYIKYVFYTEKPKDYKNTQVLGIYGKKYTQIVAVINAERNGTR